LLEKEKRVVAKASKAPPPSREMQLPILKHIAELFKKRKEIAIDTKDKSGRGIMEELMEEHIKQFPWLTRNMMNHYINTYHSDNLPIVIDTHHHNVVSGITDTSPVNAVLLRSMIPTEMSPTKTSRIPIASRTESSSMMPIKPSQGTSRRGGRPKGTTHASKQDLNGILIEALEECAVECVTLKAFARDKILKDVTGRKY
jgi:hypothetical protein